MKKLLTDTAELQKVLHTEFKMEEFIELKRNLGIGYGGTYGTAIYPIAKKANVINKVIISKSAYVALLTWYDENGRGTYGTPKKEHIESYENLIKNDNEESYQQLIDDNLYWAKIQDREDNKIKSISNALVKGLGGKTNAALFIVKGSAVNGITDGMCISYKWFEERMKKLWASESEIYKLSYRAYEYGDTTNVKLYNWIKSIEIKGK